MRTLSSVALAKAAYGESLRAMRQRYRCEPPRKPHAEASRPETQNDPCVVGLGTYRTRRAVKQAVIANFGTLPPLPSSSEIKARFAAEKQKRALLAAEKAAQHPSRTANDDLRAIFYRDLREENPRIHHLLHLWHDSDEFVTARNIEAKLDAFFASEAVDQYGIAPVAGAERLRNVVEHGIPEAHADDIPFNADAFGASDRSFRTGADVERPLLEQGSIVHHMLTRETVANDALAGTLVGRPGFRQMLQLANKD